MNGLLAAKAEVAALVHGLKGPSQLPDILVCPPATLLRALIETVEQGPVRLGGQTCHASPNGAHTGDISAEMLKDAGATSVNVGHSERRTDHKETSAQVAAQTAAAWRAGLTAIICIGETEAERVGDETEAALAAQIEGSIPAVATPQNTAVAYEPIWAIGTGKTASLADIEGAHAFIRQRIAAKLGAGGEAIRLLYGGSVKPSNANEILHTKGVDGVLVGGASLKATDFLAIIEGAKRA